ncbi:unnamed protein product [Pieris macdunnoughi]|uniref:Envelope protein n=1 Tax=Pieris macdunnoughi TaxID=345717 RepID=A0A821XTZ1_9NEOP|nr:unnamed protein product [Pieris macdunnoughi]
MGEVHTSSGFIEPLPSSSGILFDGLGKIKIKKGQLDIINYINISYIGPHLYNLNGVFTTLEEICKRANYQPCENTLSSLLVRFEDIKSEFNSISHLISNRNKRSAWFGAIGIAFRHIFGTLDEDDAIKYDQAIESVQKDEKTLAKLIKENILVTTNTLNSFKETIKQLELNEEKLNKNIYQFFSKYENVTNKLIINSSINSIISNLESSLLTMSFQVQDLINDILFASQNVFHPNILSPSQLYKELVNNIRHLPEDTHIPVPLDLSNIHLILSISSVACYYYNHKLVFILQIPLVTRETYVLYKTLAIPIPHNMNDPNSFSFILPNNPYIAISNDKNDYCIFDNLRKCSLVNSELYICETRAILSTSGNPTCETELLKNPHSSLPQQCITKTHIGPLDAWEPLTNNRWVFIQSHRNKISIDCGANGLSETTVFGTGILRIPKHCTVFTRTMKIKAYKNFKVNITTPILDFTLTNDSCCNMIPEIKSELSSDYKTPKVIDLNKLKLNSESEMKELDNLINKEPFIVKFQTHYTVSVIIIFMIFIIVLAYKLVYCIKLKKNVKLHKTTESEDVEMNVSPAPLRHLS